MTYPFSIIIPALISLLGQIALWAGYWFFIPALDKATIFWSATAAFAMAGIFLLLYRFLVSVGQKAWHWATLLAIALQIGTMVSSAWLLKQCLLS